MEIKNITIGTDPELFFKRGGEIISCEGLIGGTKDRPKAISKNGHAVQEDNIMAEFNIPPADTSEQFVDDINYVLNYLEGVAALNGAELAIEASAIVDKKYLQTKQARKFGCDPDFCVYTKEANQPPSSRGNMRTACFHIHVGYNEPNVASSVKIVKAMDLFLGVPSILMDEDHRRKKMYGKAGAMRLKEYGIEYRSLSNFILKSDELKKWAFNATISAINFVNNEENYNLLLSLEDEIVDCINNNNKELALKVMEKVEEIVIINNQILVA